MWRLLSTLLSLIGILSFVALIYWIASADTQDDGTRKLFNAPGDTWISTQARAYTDNILSNSSVSLSSPLNTFTPSVATRLEKYDTIESSIFIPDNAPSDLGVGAYVKDQDGLWFQCRFPYPLHKGDNVISFPLAEKELWRAEPDQRLWDDYHHGEAETFGLYFFSAQESQSEIKIHYVRANTYTTTDKKTITDEKKEQLFIQSIDGLNNRDDSAQWQSGKRWHIKMRPSQIPQNPFSNAELDIQLHISHPHLGSFKIPAFYMQDKKLSDRGDHEETSILTDGHYVVRFRPQRIGLYTMSLTMRTASGSKTVKLPSLEVGGENWDDYVRVDASDSRFYSIAANNNNNNKSRFFWPIGVNLRSVTDPRAQKNTHTAVTCDRGSLSYKSYIDRYAAAGANCIEIWMCSWNLALEWRSGWPGFKGMGFYNQDNAQRLDDILDHAYAQNMRVILVLNNHGQASSKVDSEWHNNPYNARNGGPIRRADDIFGNPQVIAAQQQLRRYIIARYADHPAIMSWKLWTEMDLTNEGMKTMRHWKRKPSVKLRNWHKNAANDFHQWDIYKHPVVTHWSSDYRMVDRRIAALPELDALCIDAYHTRIPGHQLLAQLISDSTLDPRHGLSVFKKPIQVTEFGGTAMACASPQLFAEHLSAPWAALVSGHGGGPLLWWFEWVDQHNAWQPYHALSRFLEHEDLRGTSRSVRLNVQKTSQKVWSRAWARKGRLLGYLLEYSWGYLGQNTPLVENSTLFIGKKVQAGNIELEWWDASTGTIIKRHIIKHPGGALEIPIPPFRRHLAFKMIRQ